MNTAKQLHPSIKLKSHLHPGMQIATNYPEDGKSPFEYSYQVSTRFKPLSDATGPLSNNSRHYGESPTMTFTED